MAFTHRVARGETEYPIDTAGVAQRAMSIQSKEIHVKGRKDSPDLTLLGLLAN